VYIGWVTDVVNALLDELENTNVTPGSADLEQNKFLVHELLMARIDRKIEPQESHEESKGSTTEDVTEIVAKARYGMQEIRSHLLFLETYVLCRKRGI
jgi:hypothetical protein